MRRRWCCSLAPHTRAKMMMMLRTMRTTTTTTTTTTIEARRSSSCTASISSRRISMMSSLTTRGGRVALNNNNNASSFQFFGVGDTRSKNNVIRGGAASCSSSRRGSGSFSSDNSNNNNNNNRGFSTTSSSSSSKSNENNSPPQGRKTRFNGDVLQTAKEKKQTKLEGQRLSKALAALGVASRRGSEAIIFDGRVKVNGTKVLEPQFKVNLDVDVIELDDKVVEGGVEYAGEHFYFLVNKPKGYVCSTKTGGGMNNRGEKEESGTGGKKALDLLQAWTEQWKKGNPGKLPPRLFTVGRLDVQTTGMLLVTTDGKWSQRVAHPSSGVVKRYVITAPERVTSAQIAKMRKGTEVDGVHVTPVLVETVTGDGGPKNRVAVEVEDGRNREVRRIAESAGVEVKNLKRTRIGGLKMPSELPAGMFCSLKPHQVSYVLEKSLQQIGGKF